MRENTARTSTRWGGAVERVIPGNSVVAVGQWVDVDLLAPQRLSLALYALIDAPIPGLTVQWTLQFGNGSFNHTERFSLPFSDTIQQVPFVLERPASTVAVSAVVTSIIPEARTAHLIALVAPSSPTWTTTLYCKEEKE